MPALFTARAPSTIAAQGLLYGAVAPSVGTGRRRPGMMPKAWYLKVTGDTETLGKARNKNAIVRGAR